MIYGFFIAILGFISERHSQNSTKSCNSNLDLPENAQNYSKKSLIKTQNQKINQKSYQNSYNGQKIFKILCSYNFFIAYYLRVLCAHVLVKKIQIYSKKAQQPNF